MAAKVLTLVSRASGSITWADQPHADDTFVVGLTTYTWKASVSTTANQIKIGTTLAGSIANAVAAINNAGGTGYGSLTAANADATATTGEAGVLVLKARTIGVSGNVINYSVGTDEGTHATATAALMSGGVGQLEELFETAVAALKNMQPNAQTLAYLEGIVYDLGL